MESSALTGTPEPPPVTQRELLGLIMGCAARRSATFSQAEWALTAAGVGDEPRAFARELLTDLAIRGWIELRIRFADGREHQLERRLWELEFAAERNWEVPVADCACYALTERGRERLVRTARR